MISNEPTYEIVDDGCIFGLDEFFANNEYLVGTYEELAIRLLDVGESYTGDEGAGGKWTIRRVS